MTDRKEAGNLQIEEAFKLLDDMIVRLESREITLEESFNLYQEGMELLKNCNDRIDMVEKKMLQLNKSGELSEI